MTHDLDSWRKSHAYLTGFSAAMTNKSGNILADLRERHGFPAEFDKGYNLAVRKFMGAGERAA